MIDADHGDSGHENCIVIDDTRIIIDFFIFFEKVEVTAL